MQKAWWLAPLYWLLAAAPLAAAFWVFRQLPTVIYITPATPVPSGRAYVFVLPAVNFALAAGLYPLSQKLGKALEQKALEAGCATDITEVLPAIRVFLMAWLAGICGAVIYGYYNLDTGRITAELLGRVAAGIPGFGTALFALRLPRATKNNTLALRWAYTVQSPQVWFKVHKLATPVLYCTGAIMVATAFLASGLWAAVTAGFALFSALFLLYFYAKHLYENEFRH